MALATTGSTIPANEIEIFNDIDTKLADDEDSDKHDSLFNTNVTDYSRLHCLQIHSKDKRLSCLSENQTAGRDRNYVCLSSDDDIENDQNDMTDRMGGEEIIDLLSDDDWDNDDDKEGGSSFSDDSWNANSDSEADVVYEKVASQMTIPVHTGDFGTSNTDFSSDLHCAFPDVSQHYWFVVMQFYIA
jgi:hypothetical protein